MELQRMEVVDAVHGARLLFRVYSDGTLTGVVTDFHVDSPHCYVYDGHAVPRPRNSPSDDVHPDDEVVFDCSFRLVRLWYDKLESELLVCEATLSQSRGVHGHFALAADTDEEDDTPANLVALCLHFAAYEPRGVVPMMQMTPVMKPLTPGRYRLTGFTVAADSRVHECNAELTLKADGSLHCIWDDPQAHQRSEATGSWSQHAVVFTFQYKITTDFFATYSCTTTPTVYGLRGSWLNVDPKAQWRQSEHGHVELVLESATREWSPPFHTLYPQVFQDVTKLLLLKSLRSPTRTTYAIPGALWQNVLQFCDFDHFVQ